MAKSAILPANDTGEINFELILSEGMVAVSVRAPLAIKAQVAKVPVTDFLEIAAQMTLESINANRQMQARLREQLESKQRATQ